jgi:hypothetical protein
VVEHLEVVNQRGEAVLACDHLLLVRRSNPSAMPETGTATSVSVDRTPGLGAPGRR